MALAQALHAPATSAGTGPVHMAVPRPFIAAPESDDLEDFDVDAVVTEHMQLRASGSVTRPSSCGSKPMPTQRAQMDGGPNLISKCADDRVDRLASGLCCHDMAPKSCCHREQHLREVNERLIVVLLQLSEEAGLGPRRSELEGEKRQLLASKEALSAACGAGSAAPQQPAPSTPQLMPTRDTGNARSLGPAVHGPQHGSGAPWNKGLASNTRAPWQPDAWPSMDTPDAWQGQHVEAGCEINERLDSKPMDASEFVPDPKLRSAALGAMDEAGTCQQVDGTKETCWGGSFPWSDALEQCNRDYFGNSKFRPNQRQVINATMAETDCFVLMPTGGGALRPLLVLASVTARSKVVSLSVDSARSCHRHTVVQGEHLNPLISSFHALVIARAHLP